MGKYNPWITVKKFGFQLLYVGVAAALPAMAVEAEQIGMTEGLTYMVLIAAILRAAENYFKHRKD